jgi:hypothetical protein
MWEWSRAVKIETLFYETFKLEASHFAFVWNMFEKYQAEKKPNLGLKVKL